MFKVIKVDASKDVMRDISAILGCIKECRKSETAKRIAKIENDKISNQVMGFKYLVFAA